MPPATAALSVSLRELADLAIGTPEVGAVNFTALHTLLVAMLKSLNLQETRIDFQSPMLDQSRSFESPRVSTSTPQLVAPKERRRSSVARAQTLETQVKDLGGQVQDLGRQLKTVGSQVQAIVAHVQHFPTQTDGLDDRDWLETKDLALVTQEKGQTGPTKGRSDSKPVFQGPELLQDLMKDMKILKEAHQKKAQPELQPEQLLQRIEELERINRERDEFLELLNRKLSRMPSSEEATMVTWEELEQAITDGWKTSESSTGLQRHKRQSSITSSDLIASGVSTKHPSDDQAVDSAGFITDNTFSGSSGIGYPFDGPPGRERSRVSSATGFPAREQHLRARDEAGLARPHPPSMSQLRAEPDRRRSREKHSSGHLRRDERDAHLGPVYQDASLSRDQHPQMSPDQHRGVFASQGHLYARPDQYGFGSFDSDQLELLYPSTYMPGMVPISVDQVGVMLPGMDEQELVVAGMAQSDAVPPLVHGRDQPGSEQPGTVPLSTYQLPGMDESGMGPLGTYQSGVVPLGVDQHGFVIYPMDQQVFVQPSLGTSGFIQPGTEQHEMIQPGAGQAGVVQPGAGQAGVVQPGAGQAGVVQPGAGQAGVVQPGAGQAGVVQPGAGQAGVVQPGAGQAGVVQPGAGQAGVIQPRAGQAGVVQPGAGQAGVVQPGAGQAGVIQPGAGQAGVVQPGAGQAGVIQPGAGQAGVVQPGAGQAGVVQPGAGQAGVVQPGAGQAGVVQPGAGQAGVIQPGAGQAGVVQPGAGQAGVIQPGAGQAGVIQPGAGQAGVVQPGAGQAGVVQPGAGQAGVIQPGAGQAGVVQPGAGQAGVIQPGAGQAGVVQPGAGQAGVVQPGAGQAGVMQPRMYPRGLVQPGMYPRGLVQPEIYPRGLVQPGIDQPGFMQPRMYPRGLVPPRMYHRGLVQPGAGHPGLVQSGAGQMGVIQPSAGQPGVVQPGAGQAGVAQPGESQAGVIQPGAGQVGVIQPGAGQVGVIQPGAGQPGLVQPQVDQYGLVQPDRGRHGFFQPNISMPGLVPPGAYPPGLVQTGAYPGGLIQPGAYPRGFMQPGADQQGLVQPVIDPHWGRQSGTGRSIIPPGTELLGFPTYRADFRSFTSPRPYQQGVAPPGRDQYGQVSSLLSSQGLTPSGTDREALVLREMYRQGLQQRGPRPLSTAVGSAPQDQQHLETPEPEQRDQAVPDSIPDSQGLMYGGPGYQGVDQHVQVGVGPKELYVLSQPGVSIQTSPGQEAPVPKSTYSLDYLDRGSSERSDTQSERRESLDKLAPSFPIAVETFRMMGEIIALYMELKENIKDLNEEQAGLTDLEKIQYLLALMVKKSIPPDLQEQLKTLKALTKEIQQEKAKMEKMSKILEGHGEKEIGKEEKGSPLNLQLGVLRVTMADIEKELGELRESQEKGKVSMEHSVSEASIYLQDQLDKLRTIIENMLASSSTLLSMSLNMAPHKPLTTLAPSQIDPAATCPACSLDLSHQVSMLVQRYEQLQNMVSNLAASRPSKKAKLQSQDEELLGHIQSAILQVQGDCEKLSITTSNLIEDRQQKQKDIEVLYQGLEKLEKEKANRGHLEMEIGVKADKSALAGKVSRVQFDATTEQLNRMMQELVAKMTGQEQDWQKMLDKLLVEMDSKLDRLELDPVKQSLEDRWKSLRQQLKERSPLYQADEAAAMRRQLLAHFHCLSCDRPLETPVTGQVIPMTPVGPCLPGHRSVRPYTVFELEQVRQQSRNLKLGSSGFLRGDLGQVERSVGRLRTMHSKMLLDIEKVQIHFGGSVKASSQMIRELLQAQCLSSPCYRRLPDMADYSYSSAPRPCGGSHTLTYPYRRIRLQHLSQGLYPTEEIQIAMKHDEVDILGLDGHIYKGRMDTRLPDLLNKDTPSRHQKDRPVSTEGRLSQLNPAHLPGETANLPAGLDVHRDAPPGEGLEEPTRGPRSTSAH
ncbi:glutamine-rich protein 2 isoform X1 [Ovis aries]|uniref:glutamine-rich protein 2 isoform X1 n=1 Tax=Ovis aries TaxID=9940 RepID=UPI001C2E7B99|nr:glutamine-rich protein 2 isoform X1 [Ovis aries]